LAAVVGGAMLAYWLSDIFEGAIVSGNDQQKNVFGCLSFFMSSWGIVILVFAVAAFFAQAKNDPVVMLMLLSVPVGIVGVIIYQSATTTTDKDGRSVPIDEKRCKKKIKNGRARCPNRAVTNGFCRFHR
jgi:hypothetical protein